jgi:hypothetical protein
MTLFQDVAPCSLVEVYSISEVLAASETLVNFYQTTWRNTPEDSLSSSKNPKISLHNIYTWALIFTSLSLHWWIVHELHIQVPYF